MPPRLELFMSQEEPKENKLEITRERAVAVLRRNTYAVRLHNGREEKDYRWVVPSREYYVHHFNWDGCKHAMALIHVDPQLAYDELISLSTAQWPNGNIGHIIFNPFENHYYSKRENWDTKRFANGDFQSTGISNPPIFGIAVEYVYRHAPMGEARERFADEIIPAAVKFHEFFKRYKDPEDSGLLTYIHPWETGEDNSPRWDEPLSHISLRDIPQHVIDDVDANRVDNKVGKASHRPKQEEYYRYMYLVDLYNKWGWDYDKILQDSPFGVKDILSSSLWAKANESLAGLLESRGDHERAKRYRGWAAHTKQALAATWSEEHQQYCDIDVARGRHEPIVKATNAMFAPLYAGAVTEEQLPKVLRRLSDPGQFWPAYPVPSTALNAPYASGYNYWRRPTWPITNEFIIDGLDRYAGQSAQAKDMRDFLIDNTLSMIADNGFFEYYDPEGGNARPGRTAPLGFGDFSWSAAVFIYLHERYKKKK